MRELAERAYFALCLTLGQRLRSARYSTVEMVSVDGDVRVRKHRAFYAPVLIWLGGSLVRVLDTGVRVLPQRAWQERERELFWALRGTTIHVDAEGALVLPRLPGATLASLLDAAASDDERRTKAIELAVVALRDFHARGFTHGDAMAENVVVDLERGAAHWFDFETVHDARRPMPWRRADDLRALVATCLVRTAAEKRAATLAAMLAAYADVATTRLLASSVSSVWRRSLAFHLGQAPLSIREFRALGRLLSAQR